jgi:AhpD family alkylhydroperoxidase
MSKLPKNFRKFQDEHKDIYEAYERLGEAAACCGPLDGKTRELVKLGMAAAIGSQGSVQSHTHRALNYGISQAEIEHAIVLGVTTLGFPRTMAALSWVREALDQA